MNARFDVLVIGSGPSGQNAAVAAARLGKRVAIVEQERKPGGACVSRGTIPSKALRETALQLSRMRRVGEQLAVPLATRTELAPLMSRVQDIVERHEAHIGAQLERNRVELVHGRARFVSDRAIEVLGVRGSARVLQADVIVLAVGSSPRLPPNVPVDHEHILDSDSILSLVYVPESLTVLGAGVIACEYASIFAELGARVTLIDRAVRPLSFMDADLVERFVSAFEARGGQFLGERSVTSVDWDGISDVVTRLSDGHEVRAHKLLVALGRTANVGGLHLDAAGLCVGERGHVQVDEHGRTAVPHIYAVGDVVGPPALAATSMEQGRRAVQHALGQPAAAGALHVPIGIYTIPEMSSVGLDEREAIARHGQVLIGCARFEEVARGQISGDRDGLLKLVCDPTGTRLLGAQVIGDGATELVHLAQLALVVGLPVDALIENIFNFPTLAEAYRIAALEVRRQRPSP